MKKNTNLLEKNYPTSEINYSSNIYPDFQQPKKPGFLNGPIDAEKDAEISKGFEDLGRARVENLNNPKAQPKPGEDVGMYAQPG